MAKHFTKQEIDEIRQQMATYGVRDTEFPETSELNLEDYVPIIQEGKNKIIPADVFHNKLANGPRGFSAYEIAVQEGYTGTREEWLNDPVNGIKGNGIQSIAPVGTPSSADSAVNTYRISLCDGTIFDFDVHNGKGISSVEELGTHSTADSAVNTYRITLSDNTTFDFSVKNGTGITSIEQTIMSTEDGGNNIITVTLSNGQTRSFTIKNGTQGNSGVVLDGVTEETFVADMIVNNDTDGGTTKAWSAERGRITAGTVADIKPEMVSDSTFSNEQIAGGTPNNYHILAASGLYNTDSTYKHFRLIVRAGQTVYITANGSAAAYITFLSSSAASSSGGTPAYATGYTTVVQVPKGTTKRFVVPVDAVRVYLDAGKSSDSYPYLPETVVVRTVADKADKPETATEGNVAMFDGAKNPVDAGMAFSDIEQAKKDNDLHFSHTDGDNDNDFYITDTGGNAIAKFANGHIYTKNFDSSIAAVGENTIIDDVPASLGVAMVIKKAYDLINLTYMLRDDIPAYTSLYGEGDTVKSILYSSTRKTHFFVPNAVSIETFLSAISDKKSSQYTDSPNLGASANLYYGIVCGMFAAYCLGIKIMYDTNFAFWSIPGMTLVETQDAQAVQLGDILNDSYSHAHCLICVGIKRKKLSGEVTQITLAESLFDDGNTPICRAVSYTPTEFNAILASYHPTQNRAYTIIRYTKIHENTYDGSIVKKYVINKNILPKRGNKAMYGVGDSVVIDVLDKGDYTNYKLFKNDVLIATEAIGSGTTISLGTLPYGRYKMYLTDSTNDSLPIEWIVVDYNVTFEVVNDEAVKIYFSSANATPLSAHWSNDNYMMFNNWPLSDADIDNGYIVTALTTDPNLVSGMDRYAGKGSWYDALHDTLAGGYTIYPRVCFVTDFGIFTTPNPANGVQLYQNE